MDGVHCGMLLLSPTMAREANCSLSPWKSVRQGVMRGVRVRPVGYFQEGIRTSDGRCACTSHRHATRLAPLSPYEKNAIFLR